MTEVPPTFLAHILGFLGSLRAASLPADPAGAIALCEALGHIDLADARDFHSAARALLVHRHEHLAPFDEVFREYWYRQRRPGTLAPGEHHAEVSGRRSPPVPSAAPGEETGGGGERSPAGYSAAEVLARKDLATLTDADLERARAMLREFVRLFATLRAPSGARSARRRPGFQAYAATPGRAGR